MFGLQDCGKPGIRVASCSPFNPRTGLYPEQLQELGNFNVVQSYLSFSYQPCLEPVWTGPEILSQKVSHCYCQVKQPLESIVRIFDYLLVFLICIHVVCKWIRFTGKQLNLANFNQKHLILIFFLSDYTSQTKAHF